MRTRAALASEVERRAHVEQLYRELRQGSLEVREEEQRRIARDLHDQIGQTITVLRLALAAGKKAVREAEVVAARLAEAELACEELERGLSAVAAELRPRALDELGLPAAVDQLVEQWRARVTVDIDLQILGLRQRLPSVIETALYRIVQEALTNVARHSCAQRAQVLVQRTRDFILVSVEDDGKGFDLRTVPLSRHGLAGMRERVLLLGGTIEIEAWPNAGTQVVARLPLPKTDGDAAPSSSR